MPHRLTPVARRLRSDATAAERSVWRVLRGRQIGGFRFRRQAPLCGYVVDFICQDAKVIVEIDGATHSKEAERAYDAKRQDALEAAGYAVLRFGNANVYEHLDGVAETIRLKLIELRPRVDIDDDRSTPNPVHPPQAGEGR
jgi:very-short-patch-repair endonuclease